MKDHKEEIDDLIHQALSEEEASFYDNLDEQGITEMVTSLFKGKRKWLGVGSFVFGLVFLVLSVYFLIEFINTTDVIMSIRWGAAMFACWIAHAMIKLWAWMQFNRNDLMREIKRLELQISILVKNTKNGSSGS